MSRTAEKPAPQRDIVDRRGAILEAATKLFVERGFAGTTTDEITRRAGASKETIYHHFGSKLGLFDAVVQRLTVGLTEKLQCPGDEGTAEQALTAFGRHYLTLILKPDALGVFRLVIGESANLPELGTVFHQRAPAVAIGVVADFLKRLSARGLLKVDDAETAAIQFLASLRCDLHLRALLTHATPTPDEIERAVTNTVRFFMRGYGGF